MRCSARPVATATGMPPSDPLRVVSGVLKSVCASSHSMPMRIGSRVGPLAPMAHGSTFGGNPLACAAALATLQVMADEDLPGRAARLGSYLLDRLCRLDAPVIRQVRVQVVGAARVLEVGHVAILAPGVVARVEGLDEEAPGDPVLALRARRLVAGPVGAEGRLVQV